MPIKVPNGLPAISELKAEQVFVMNEDRAEHQDIRPLNLLMLNLMPNKINTELQYLRKLSNTPLQVNIQLLRIDKHISRNTPQSHLDTFYADFEDVSDRYYDGMIVTGAPLDQIAFDEVNYWDKLEIILRWTKDHVTSTLFSCWAAAAALKVFYDLPMFERDSKISGVYSQHTSAVFDDLTRGFDDHFLAPLSRFIDFPHSELKSRTGLIILAESDRNDVYLAVSPDHKQVYVTGHPEYDATTLSDEYHRDLTAGKKPRMPENYFPFNDPSFKPACAWRSHASMLFGNWLNYYVYQITPFAF